MSKYIVSKKVAIIQLYASTLLLLLVVILLISSSYFVYTHAILAVLILAFLFQSLVVTFLVFKIINFEIIMDRNEKKYEILSICNRAFSVYNSRMKHYRDLFAKIEINLTTPNSPTYSEIAAQILKKTKTTTPGVTSEALIYEKLTYLQNKILYPDHEWCNLNDLILCCLKCNQHNLLKNHVVFHVNKKLKLLELDKECLMMVLNLIITNSLSNNTEETTLTINIIQRKSWLKIAFEIGDSTLSEANFKFILEDHFTKNLSPTDLDIRVGISLFTGYLAVNDGRLLFEDSKNDKKSKITLLFNSKGKTKYKP